MENLYGKNIWSGTQRVNFKLNIDMSRKLLTIILIELIIAAVAVVVVSMSGCDKPVEPEPLQYTTVTFELGRFKVEESKFRESSSEEIIGWTHIYNSETFTLVLDDSVNVDRPQIQVTGTYNNLAGVSAKVPYGKYEIFLMPNNEPDVTDGLIYFASAQGAQNLNTASAVVKLNPSSNYALVRIPIADNITSVTGAGFQVYQSQGFWYIYTKIDLDFIFVDDLGDELIYPFLNPQSQTGYLITLTDKTGVSVTINPHNFSEINIIL